MSYTLRFSHKEQGAHGPAWWYHIEPAPAYVQPRCRVTRCRTVQTLYLYYREGYNVPVGFTSRPRPVRTWAEQIVNDFLEPRI